MVCSTDWPLTNVPLAELRSRMQIPPLLEPKLSVAAGDLRIVEPNGVRVIPAQGDGTECELEPLSLVGPLDHEQGGHEVIISSAGTQLRLR